MIKHEESLSPNPLGNHSSRDDIIKIAVMAVGGQGGGVLTQWMWR